MILKWFSDINSDSIILPKFTSRFLDTDLLKCVLTILQIRFFSPFMWDIVSTYLDQRFSTFNRNFLHLSSLLFRRCFRLSDFQFPCHYKFSSKIKTTMIHFLWGKKIKDIMTLFQLRLSCNFFDFQCEMIVWIENRN